MIMTESLSVSAMDMQASSEQNPIVLENDSITYDMIDSTIKNGRIINISDKEVEFSMTESINAIQTRGEEAIKNEVKTNEMCIRDRNNIVSLFFQFVLIDHSKIRWIVANQNFFPVVQYKNLLTVLSHELF